jgi:hypothetical protein
MFLRVDHLGEQVDARLVIDAGVEIDVVHDMAVEAGCFSMSARPR